MEPVYLPNTLLIIRKNGPRCRRGHVAQDDSGEKTYLPSLHCDLGEIRPSQVPGRADNCAFPKYTGEEFGEERGNFIYTKNIQFQQRVTTKQGYTSSFPEFCPPQRLTVAFWSILQGIFPLRAQENAPQSSSIPLSLAGDLQDIASTRQGCRSRMPRQQKPEQVTAFTKNFP